MLSNLSKICLNLELRLSRILAGIYPNPEICFDCHANHNSHSLVPEQQSSPFENTILWAVPKSRRSLERRLQRKFGWPSQVWKPHRVKTNLIPCVTCGNYHEASYLCKTCYNRVKQETEKMHERIEEELKLKPIQKEVVLVYDGESSSQFKGKQIVEMKKPRPAWFSKNLLQKTTDEPSTTIADIKPKNLA